MNWLRKRKTEIRKMEPLQKPAGVFRSKGAYSTRMDGIANQLMMMKGREPFHVSHAELSGVLTTVRTCFPKKANGGK